MPVNAVSVAWVLYLDVLYCFPTAMPVTPDNMSYVSVVSVGLVAFVISLWFLTKRSTFRGPKINLDLLHARRVDALADQNMLDGQDVDRVSTKGPSTSKTETT